MAIKMEGNFASNLGLETKLIGNNFPSLETLQKDWEKLLKITFGKKYVNHCLFCGAYLITAMLCSLGALLIL